MSEFSRIDQATREAAFLRVQSSPWAILPEAMQDVLAAVRIGVLVEEDNSPAPPVLIDQLPPDVPEDRVPRLPRTDKAVAVISVRGAIGQRRGGDYWAGVYSEEIGSQMMDMAANAAVGAIVLDIDSPGGLASGMKELATTARQVREVKPVYAVANPMAASAAFYTGSQATKLFVAPSGSVGSVGVIWPHMDVSEALSQIGIKMTFVHAGKYKTEGNMAEPLSEEALAERQRVVDRLYGEFVADVAAGRNTDAATVRDTFGEGRMVESDRAMRLGMVDGVATLSELLAGIIKPTQQGRTRSLAAAVAIEDEAGHAIGKTD